MQQPALPSPLAEPPGAPYHQPVGVRIVTDSTACIPPHLVDDLRIEVVPVHLILAGRTYVDSVTADTAEFYDLLRASDEQPTTAAPSPGMFLEAVRRAASAGDDVLCITVSKQFSAMYDSAREALRAAAGESPEIRASLLDSRNAAMAQGFVVLEAARAAAAGAPLDDALARAEAAIPRVTLLAMLDTLAYLARGGRVPRVAAWATELLQLKPIVRFGAGGIRLVARTRTRARALDRLVELLATACAGRRVRLAVHHADAAADAAYVLERARATVDVSEAYLTEFTQVMGVHTGPGLVGFAFLPEDR
jgi:DegV family protein with EDD domain